ncbi:MAG TPA: hypothetical protein VFT27_05405 [Actinomycetota bacterium]|nr:hypothetical protein [Actinomycetota bacterium]
MTNISVLRGTDVERLFSRFEVTLEEDGAATRHVVTLSAGDYERLGGAYPTPEDFIRACFSFLLEREPKESILTRFDVAQIGDYFPEFERTIQAP